MPFQVDSDLDVCYGFYEKKSHRIVPIDQCIISDDVTNDIIYYINRFLNIFHIKIYDEDTHKGLFREVMIRHTATDEYMVVIVSTHDYDFSVILTIPASLRITSSCERLLLFSTTFPPSWSVITSFSVSLSSRNLSSSSKLLRTS